MRNAFVVREHVEDGEELVSLIEYSSTQIEPKSADEADLLNGSTTLLMEAEDESKTEGHYSGIRTIDWSFCRVQAKIERLNRIRSLQGRNLIVRNFWKAYDAMESWILLALIGITCGVIATFVDVGADWATDLKFGYCGRGFWINRGVCCRDSSDMMGCPEWQDLSTEPHLAFMLYVGMAVAMATYSAWLTSTFAPYAAGSGIPEIKIILGGFAIPRFLGFWTLLIKIVGLILSVGSGICIGKEGPFVHVCMCVGNLWSRSFGKYRHNEGRRREFLSCAAAAGVGVAFGAPIGGVLFSLEQAAAPPPPSAHKLAALPHGEAGGGRSIPAASSLARTARPQPPPLHRRR